MLSPTIPRVIPRPGARATVIISAFVVALAATGCTGDEVDGPSLAVSGSSAPLPPGVPTPQQLADALVTSVEVPADYDEVAPSEDGGQSDVFEGTCLEGVHDLDQQVGAEPVSEARVEFSHQDGDGEAQILSSIGVFTDEEAIADALTAFSDRLDDCPSVSRTDEDGVTYNFQVEVSAEPTLDDVDQQLLVQLDGIIAAGPEALRLSFGILLARTEGYVSRLSTAELGEDHGLDREIEPLAAQQHRRLVGLLS